MKKIIKKLLKPLVVIIPNFVWKKIPFVTFKEERIFSLTIDSSIQQKMIYLRDRSDCEDADELLEKALGLYYWHLKREDEGKKVIAVEAGGKREPTEEEIFLEEISTEELFTRLDLTES